MNLPAEAQQTELSAAVSPASGEAMTGAYWATPRWSLPKPRAGVSRVPPTGTARGVAVIAMTMAYWPWRVVPALLVGEDPSSRCRSHGVP